MSAIAQLGSLAVLAQRPSPAGTTSPGTQVHYSDPAQVTPGTIGFIATALVAILTVFLIRDATRRVRRVRAADDAHTVSHFPIERRPRIRPKDGGDAVPAHRVDAQADTAAGDGAATAEDPERNEEPPTAQR
ncbi:hypothetical protein BRM1_00350 [Brevibacterium sp. BRM-1]|uniref:hypothetical protein n=1 Tax=Brevibacterium sp. BRM-1 TaxID=2999062 RepID=UPI002282CBBE|nr:hypothetical protein [Brevibacterium sp. BRM-1]WAL40365.1 hypothetical protein BRM1_00350 [Brevibacterium sp. BRM-1]